jgi:hypothetical protein
MLRVRGCGFALGGQYALSPELNHVTSSQQNLRPLPRGCARSQGQRPEIPAREVSQWKVVTEHHITRTFTFPDFRNALDFV